MSTVYAPVHNKFKTVGVIILIVLILIVLGLFLNQQVIQKYLIQKTPLTILLIGMDSERSTLESPTGKTLTRTDSLILTIIDPGRGKVSLVSIPKDTLVNMGGRIDRINQASTIGGIPLAKKLVTQLTGYTIDRYVTINFNNFKYLIDLLGGVTIVVDQKMQVLDSNGKTIMILEPGEQLLDGAKALLYVRYRNYLNKNVESEGHQRTLLLAVLKKMSQPANLFRLPAILNSGKRYLQTDLTNPEIYPLITWLVLRVKPSRDLSSSTLPGNFYQSYWQPDLVQADQLLNSIKPTNLTRKNLCK